jgi:dihydrofolate reductase
MPARRIEGFAIVSEDGMLADASGVMPQALKVEADQRFFEAGMNRVDVAVHGRHSHEGQPNSPGRKRLIATGKVAKVGPDPANDKAWFWNPAGASLDEALAAIGEPDAAVGIVGGTDIFGLFLDRYDVFHLTRGPKVRLPGGRPVFPQVPRLTPEQVLAEHGYVAGPAEVLDATHDIVATPWRRP